MTVAEMIEQLQKFDGSCEVFVADGDYGSFAGEVYVGKITDEASYQVQDPDDPYTSEELLEMNGGAPSNAVVIGVG